MTEAIPAAHPRSSAARVGMGVLLAVVGILITAVVTAPIALSSNDLIDWARAGLALSGPWPLLVFVALDAAAGTCVLLSVWCAARDMSAGAFGLGVWVFAGISATANYRHGLAVADTAPDAAWFFPLMSLLGPGLLEGVVRLIRRVSQKATGRRASDRPKFGLVRWLPIVGSPRDTYGARRTAQILTTIRTVDEAVRTYHVLCPDGSLRILRAIRERDVAAAEAAARLEREAADDAARFARAAARAATNGPIGPRLVAVDRASSGRVAAATSGPSVTTIRASLATGHPTSPADHSAMAVADAATIRARWPEGLPDRGAQRLVRSELGWHAEKATRALRAYQDQVDLPRSAPAAEQSSGSADPANR